MKQKMEEGYEHLFTAVYAFGYDAPRFLRFLALRLLKPASLKEIAISWALSFTTGPFLLPECSLPSLNLSIS